jgi:hypothetical protein
MAQFPPDQDLAPGDKSLTTVIEADTRDDKAARILRGARAHYSSPTGIGGGPCDVVLILMPAGKGRAFVDGMGMAMEAQGKLVNRDEWSGS